MRIIGVKLVGFSNNTLVLAAIATKRGKRVDFFGRTTHLTSFVLCKKYVDPFGSPGAKPLAGAERQKEMSPKERSDHISGTIGIFLGLGTY